MGFRTIVTTLATIDTISSLQDECDFAQTFFSAGSRPLPLRQDPFSAMGWHTLSYSCRQIDGGQEKGQQKHLLQFRKTMIHPIHPIGK